MPVTRRWFPFVQLEFTHSLGPAAGRYVLAARNDPEQREAARDQAQRSREALAAQAAQPGRRFAGAGAGEPADADGSGGGGAATETRVPVRTPAEEQEALLGSADVLVLQVFGAPAAKRGIFKNRGASKTAKDDDPPAEVPLNVATVIRGPRMLEDARAGDRLLSGLDPMEQERWAEEAVRDVNRAVGAYRVSAADPYCMDVTRADPRAVRIGYGIAEEVFSGRWSKAIVLGPRPAPKLSRSLRLAPAQGTAALLAGQAKALESEELVLRALMDLDQGRLRAAAVGLQAGLDLMLGELAGESLPGSVRTQVDTIAELRQPLSVLAAQARREPLGATARKALVDHAEQIGATIDRWRYEPLGY